MTKIYRAADVTAYDTHIYKKASVPGKNCPRKPPGTDTQGCRLSSWRKTGPESQQKYAPVQHSPSGAWMLGEVKLSSRPLLVGMFATNVGQFSPQDNEQCVDMVCIYMCRFSNSLGFISLGSGRTHHGEVQEQGVDVRGSPAAKRRSVEKSGNSA